MMHERTLHRLARGVLVLVGLVAATPSVARAGDAVDAGDVMIVHADTGQALTEGDSLTPFGLVLPEGATCPGDSMHDNYRVQTFLVPESTDLSSMVYSSLQPVGDEHNLTMRTVGGTQYIHENTQMNQGPGEEAIVLPLPAFDLKLWSPEALYPGVWKLGVACTPASRVVDRYWDAQIEVTEDLSVEPGQRRFTVLDEYVPDEPFPWLRVGLIAVAVASVIVFVVAGRFSRGGDAPASGGASTDDTDPIHPLSERAQT